mmetsp:Transcript_27016/g.44551  ORF Transcript_27016/g.44551 Transcript_27016/m.44551 type:complete len:95 (-) Transcript_27016:248-532(-)
MLSTGNNIEKKWAMIRCQQVVGSNQERPDPSRFFLSVAPVAFCVAGKIAFVDVPKSPDTKLEKGLFELGTTSSEAGRGRVEKDKNSRRVSLCMC